MTELLTTIVRVTVHHRKPIPKLADAVSSRAWSIDGVESTEGEIDTAQTPQAPQAVALTEAQRGDLVIEHLGPAALTGARMSVYEAFSLGIAASEAAHGITQGENSHSGAAPKGGA